MKKFLLVGLMLLSSVSLAACGGNSSKSNSANSASSSSKVVVKSERADFNNLKFGDLHKKAAGGTTLAAAKKQFGKPSTTTESKINDIAVQNVTWTNIDKQADAKIVLSFTNDKAFGAQLINYNAKRKNTIDLKQFNTVKKGDKVSKATDKFGLADEVTQTLIDGQKALTETYTSGVKGNDASFVIVAANDKITHTSQTNMK
ncbi:hypothetical protein FC83_GL000865 [Agrilactobacillus composti DSM 18527 = JCM 14202]|uniref:Lipoprotein n=1 Tax=Agrilactobacillus composti DSM 18527 = JCM 14202 TaxID=1423734 RepID=X0PRD8_9LACO|nr:DUF3862 domain-containing protein [Agrilactobacillus composti]KRM35837.1 hypothetical protein FC83_GL000865 [Agrilactobacillus composti DSM 18527 = JCM 14202]GAF39716.1 lipoprotein [Agrilactobacillus composti DSM 18527 = JCM 14202]